MSYVALLRAIDTTNSTVVTIVVATVFILLNGKKHHPLYAKNNIRLAEITT